MGIFLFHILVKLNTIGSEYKVFFTNANLQATVSVNAINEAYFGKTKELLEIEHNIGVIRTKYMNNPSDVNSSEDMLKLGEMFADYFGFKEFYISIDMLGTINACTYPIDIAVGTGNPAKWVKVDSKGFKYSKEAGYTSIVYVNKGAFFGRDFTNGEILALILHEVGHNFQAALNGTVRGFSYVNQAINVILLPITILQSLLIGKPQTSFMIFKGARELFVTKINDLKKNHPELVNSYNAAVNVLNTAAGIVGIALDSFSIVSMMLNPIMAFQSAIKTLISKLTNISTYINIPDLLVGFKKEALSDNFASSYGYGSELSSALRKAKDLDFGYVNRTVMRNMGFLGTYMDFLLLPNKLLLGMLDPHPNTEFRFQDQINYLKKELNKQDISASAKRDIKKQIEDIEKEIKKFTDAKQQGFEISNMLAQMSLAMCGGDFRGFIAHGNADDFDKLVTLAELNN